MPTFDTPNPVSVSLDLVVCDVRVTASDRADTTVEVRPSNAAAETDVRTAEQTHVEFTDGRLTIRMPKQRGRLGIFGRPGSVDLTIALPTGSRLDGGGAVTTIHTEGRLGSCRLRTATGSIVLGDAGDVDLQTSAGGIEVGRIDGHAQVTTAAGRVRLGDVAGNLAVRNSNGDTRIGAVGGDLRAKAANGDITVDRTQGTVTAATANGDVSIGMVAAGSVSLKTGFGEVSVGVPAGTAARLDLHTQHGQVVNDLATCEPPGHPDGTVEVTARTSFGDIVVHRR
ncbi:MULTISPECIES: DUF4097 family beta strand repeat-containing protein [Micromonospora]|uniref:Putative adhesin n=1 Tax=Micromonospora yangpuensis TaxID=683228 RepID=A0A1C6V0L0_9ACTN|nr:DUF4097 family beta strand repeat-containing protein [Micromonospora yangpuensis]GGL97042.1 hypothetical protein GCM10012279_13120 [Micromonospora yangpuensis]SCL59838.1 Putative adhesin [Micromonospora yangpuensis]